MVPAPAAVCRRSPNTSTASAKRAERERERQHRLLLAQRAKRARPVAMTRARVEVFSSVREAVRDDESDHDSAAGSSDGDGASAADDESEDGRRR